VWENIIRVSVGIECGVEVEFILEESWGIHFWGKTVNSLQKTVSPDTRIPFFCFINLR